MRSITRRNMTRALAALLAASALPALGQSPCPQYKDRPSVMVNTLWRTASSNLQYRLAGATVDILNDQGRVIATTKSDSAGKAYFPRLPVGQGLRARVTYGNRQVYVPAPGTSLPLRWFNNPCDAHVYGVTLVL